MSVTTAPRSLDLQALIEEAKLRARQRRVAFAALAAALAAASIAAVLALSGGSANPPAPQGFTVMKARGRVAHAVIDYVSSVRLTSLKGVDRPAKTGEEVWYDARGGLWRDVVRVDGRVRSDRAGICPVSPKEPQCEWAQPLRYLRPWPSASGLHKAGKGTFRGLPVIWLEARHPVSPPPGQVIEQVG